MFKKTTAFLLSLVLLLACFSASYPAFAEQTTQEILLELTKKFPHKSFWNHVGSSENNPDGVTDEPCPSHKGIDWDTPNATCNRFENAIQCMGFAYKVAYDIVKSSPRNWEKSETLNAKKLRVGDVIRYRNSRHSLTVTGVSGNKISFVDANWNPGCEIRWGTMELSQMPGFSYVLHAKGNNRKNTNLTFHDEAVRLGEAKADAKNSAEEIWLMTGDSSLNVRSGASVNKKQLGSIPPGASFKVLQKVKGKTYLWGKVKYGLLTGWAVLDFSRYVGGGRNAPVLTPLEKAYPASMVAKLSWSAVEGAQSYFLTLLDAQGNTSLLVSTKDTFVSFVVPPPGDYTVKVTSVNSHAPSWRLESASAPFRSSNASDIKVGAISLDKAFQTVVKGEKTKLSASVSPVTAANKTLLWSSSKPSVAFVDQSGLVTSLSFGKANITASSTDGSNVSAVFTLTVAPSAVEKIYQTEKRTTTNGIRVCWSAVPGVKSYRLYRYNKKTGNYRFVCNTEKTYHILKNLSPGREYIFAVKAFADTAEGKIPSAASALFTLSTKPASPVLRVKEEGKKVTVSWKAVRGATGYEVFEKRDGKYVLLKRLSASKTSFSKKLKSSSKVKLAVKAVTKKNGVSLYSSRSKPVSARAK